MIENRFSDEMMAASRLAAQPSNAFLFMSVPASAMTQTAPLVCLYQQMYERAVQAQQAPKVRDLFAIMN